MKHIVEDVLLVWDIVLVFWKEPRTLTDEINRILDCWDNEPAFPVSLWYEQAENYSFNFMGSVYPCTRLWFDHEYEEARNTYNYFYWVRMKELWSE